MDTKVCRTHTSTPLSSFPSSHFCLPENLLHTNTCHCTSGRWALCSWYLRTPCVQSCATRLQRSPAPGALRFARTFLAEFNCAMFSPASTLILSLVLSFAPRLSQATCYWQNSTLAPDDPYSIAPDDTACFPDQDNSPCCGTGWTCLSDGRELSKEGRW